MEEKKYRCIKCGSRKRGRDKYCKPNTFGDNCRFDNSVEHIHQTCAECGYEDYVLCLDGKPEMVANDGLRKMEFEEDE